ncbi:MAG: GGDEF domain-containing protein, partial [Brevinema sp.]
TYKEISQYLDETVLSTAIVKHIFNSSYDIIILDTISLTYLKEKNIIFNEDDISLHPVLLLVDDFSTLDLDAARNLRIFNIINASNLSQEELYTHFILLKEKFSINKKASTWALMDALTNVFNRRTFYNYLSKFLSEYKMRSTDIFCVAILDIDHFKFVNDTFGHNAGDQVLKVLAHIISEKTRETDIVARIGGEEFAIIFSNTSIDSSYKILERIREAMLQTSDIDEHLKITFSAGLVTVNANSNNVEELIGLADLLLYKAKDMGRDKICF